jgi:hypothetical protein
MICRAISVSLTVLNEIAGAPEIPAPGLHLFYAFPHSSSARCALFLRLAVGLAVAHIIGLAQQASSMENSPKAQKGIGMEGFIARWYARQTVHDADEFSARRGALLRTLARVPTSSKLRLVRAISRSSWSGSPLAA